MKSMRGTYKNCPLPYSWAKGCVC